MTIVIRIKMSYGNLADKDQMRKYCRCGKIAPNNRWVFVKKGTRFPEYKDAYPRCIVCDPPKRQYQCTGCGKVASYDLLTYNDRCRRCSGKEFIPLQFRCEECTALLVHKGEKIATEGVFKAYCADIYQCEGEGCRLNGMKITVPKASSQGS